MNQADSVRVLIVDDHQVMATSLAQALENEADIAVVGIAGTLERTYAMVATSAPDVLLLDHRLPDGKGVEAVARLKEQRPSMAVIILTASDAEHLMVTAIEAGASGFLSKTRSLVELTSAVRMAAAGEAVISPEMLSRLLPKLSHHHRSTRTTLTEREREVLALVSVGMTNAAIAQELYLSVHTVRSHVANLSTKLGARSKLEALSIALREGLLPDR